MSKPILCVDFDGVIHSYSSGWQGADVVADPPVPGVVEWLWNAVKYFDVQIYSSRSSQTAGVKAMRFWLNEVDNLYWQKQPARPKTSLIMLVKFPEQKPAAFLTIDDRALCFEGDWSKIDAEALLNFKPWNKRAPKPITERGLSSAAPALLAACREFVRKVECGEAVSVRSYAQMKAAIAIAERFSDE